MTKRKRGTVTCEVVSKNNVFCGYENLAIGKIFWTVHDGRGGGFDTLRQEDAEIIGSLWRLERILKARKR